MNDAFDVIEGDVLVRDGRIARIGPTLAGERVDRTIDGRGAYLLPGFIQTHLHLCQTLFRGYADDLALLDWLKTRVWPMEAAHTPASLAAAARIDRPIVRLADVGSDGGNPAVANRHVAFDDVESVVHRDDDAATDQ